MATVPYHVLIMLVVWTAFAWLYFKKRPAVGRNNETQATLHLAWFWLTAAVVTDFACFVLPNMFTLTRNAYSFTPYDFYVNYQPWISLIYIAIFLSPWVRLVLSRWRAKTNR
jgi:hypothetical protein